MTKQVRWKCANCNHGLLAPMKPRKNDVRRYCLPCSAKTGKLVERISPTLEKQRATKTVQRKVKTQKKNAKISVSKKVSREKVSAVNKRQAMIEKEGERIWKLMGAWHKGKAMPRIQIKDARNERGHGWSNCRNLIQVNIRPKQTERGSKWAWYVLAHELAHCACPPIYKEGATDMDFKTDVHHKEFYKALKHACEKRWKVSVSFAEVRGQQYGYAVDHLIEAQVLKAVEFRVASIR
jgi:hypothetical protein